MQLVSLDANQTQKQPLRLSIHQKWLAMQKCHSPLGLAKNLEPLFSGRDIRRLVAGPELRYAARHSLEREVRSRREKVTEAGQHR